MAEPVDPKIFEKRANESGLLAYLQELAAARPLGRRQGLTSMVVELINQGKIELYSERDTIALGEFEGRDFWDLQTFLCDLIPEADTVSATIMSLTEALVEKGAGDGMANRPNEAFRKWCARDASRSLEIVSSAREGDKLAARHLGLALEASCDAKNALALLSDERRGETHLGAITALGRIDLDVELARKAAATIEIYACDHAKEIVRNNALISTFAILKKHADLDRAPAIAALTRATKDATSENLHAIATVLWLHSGSMTDEEVAKALRSLEDVDPGHAGTLSRIDMSVGNLVSAGHFDQLTDFVKAYTKRRNIRDPLETFGALRSELIKNSGSLESVFVDWFLDGDFSLCASLASMLIRVDGEEFRLSLSSDCLPSDTEEQLILCRRAVGHIFQSPVTAASVIVSVLERGDDACKDELKSLLLDPLLYSYGGGLKRYLEEVVERLSDPAGEVLQSCLETKAEMLEKMEGIESLKELHPSESHRQLERVRWHRHMEAAVREGMTNSVLIPLVTTQTLLYGTKASSYIPDQGGEHRKVDMSMGAHSVTQEYPQLDIFDPEGLQHQLLALKIGQRVSP